MNSIGILQGRLSQSLDGRFQFFPKDWEAEFAMAKTLGIDAVEWLVDWPDYHDNPILTAAGRGHITEATRRSGVVVSSICADYYMKYRFTGDGAEGSVIMLRQLVDAASATTQKLILVPLLEANAPKTNMETEEMITAMKPVFPLAKARGVRIAFETEMPATKLLSFLERCGSDSVGVYYDIGNCTSYGFDCPRDIVQLGSRIFGVHIKDRKIGTAQSVILGQGDSDYLACFAALDKVGFSGIPIMQAWRGEHYIDDAKSQLAFLRRQMQLV